MLCALKPSSLLKYNYNMTLKFVTYFSFVCILFMFDFDPENESCGFDSMLILLKTCKSKCFHRYRSFWLQADAVRKNYGTIGYAMHEEHFAHFNRPFIANKMLLTKRNKLFFC